MSMLSAFILESSKLILVETKRTANCFLKLRRFSPPLVGGGKVVGNMPRPAAGTTWRNPGPGALDASN